MHFQTMFSSQNHQLTPAAIIAIIIFLFLLLFVIVITVVVVVAHMLVIFGLSVTVV